MARLEAQLAEAAAALATLDEAVEKEPRSLIERDSAILRLIYTLAMVWKACRHLLSEREGIEVASPNSTIRAARRLGWLSDEDAEAAIQARCDRDLAFQMYRAGIGDEIAERLAGHAALLRRWLEALQRRATAE
jgi:prephenate dehydratase